MKSISVPSTVLAFLFLAAQVLAGPVSHYGALKVCGNNICGSVAGTESTPVMLKGPSLYWSSGIGSPFYNQETLDWFVDAMQIGVIRAAMAIRYADDGQETMDKPGGMKGYYWDPEGQKSLIKTVVNAAIANDIYVIVDWHSTVAQNETESAKSFFVEMANEYKNVPNIIWEVFNEPRPEVSAQQVITHANTIISALRAAGNNNIVLVGSSPFSSRPDQSSSAFGSAAQAQTQNVAFTVHFYAATSAHDAYMNYANTARTNGFAVFATEWGFSDAYGKGGISDASNWISWMDQNNISGCNWAITAGLETSSIFISETSTSNLSESRFSQAGGYFKTYMGTKKWTASIPATHPKANDVTFDVNDGETATFTAAQLGIGSATVTEVKSRETFPVEVSKTDNSIIYKADGSQKGKIVLIYKVAQNNITVQGKITVNIKNRLPIVPQKDPITVSRKAPTILSTASSLGVSDPEGTGIQLESVSISPASAGTVAFSGLNITFTPAAGADGTDPVLSYTVKNSKGSRTGTITLKIRNIAPTIRSITSTYAPSVENTAPVSIGIDRFSGKDEDGDSIWFDIVYLDPQYPGELKNENGSWVYYPEAGKIGKVYFLAVITDGSLKSPTGRVGITLTGTGTEINVTPPTSIPGVIDPPDPIITHYNSAKGMGLSSLGFGKIELYFAKSGFAKLDVYSLSGKNLGNLLSGHQNAGSKEVSLRSLNLQKGVYILRLSQGSQVKTLRVVN